MLLRLHTRTIFCAPIKIFCTARYVIRCCIKKISFEGKVNSNVNKPIHNVQYQVLIRNTTLQRCRRQQRSQHSRSICFVYDSRQTIAKARSEAITYLTSRSGNLRTSHKDLRGRKSRSNKNIIFYCTSSHETKKSRRRATNWLRIIT